MAKNPGALRSDSSRAQSSAAGRANNRAIMEVPYWAWTKAQEEITGGLHKHRKDDDLKFSYPLLRNILLL